MTNALQLAVLSLSMIEQILAATTQVSFVLRQAASEGRDVTQAELDASLDRVKAAVAAWQAVQGSPQ